MPRFSGGSLMADLHATELSETVLHEWHVAHGARMVEFGGWDMPVQYRTGIIQEHLATRRHVGLFDVSHMGRFRFRGSGAEAFLLGVLTNNARALRNGHAQYTFIATESGGAVDDAYLYRLAADDFLLVVNAANRGKDWSWLRRHCQREDVAMLDESEELAMISLQGPHAAALLEHLGARDLPENKRNRLSMARVGDHRIIVGRTGYTGEAVGFELFPPRAFAVELWQKLVALGAVPVGLGARDSLRLEAGLPLYGHELGQDVDGNEIPCFANAIAELAVRAPGGGDYIGREALDRQRAAFRRIRRGEATGAGERDLLPRLVQAVAVFGGRRPLRAGFLVFHDGQPVGYVTSGTSVPFSRFYGEGVTALPALEHDMRPIGLALIDAALRYRSDRPVVLQVADERGNRIDAELVERNLWPTAPYARAYPGFEPPPHAPRVEPAEVHGLAGRLAREAVRNTRWRQRECVNLIPSEQTPSRYVRRLCIADPEGRYNEHNRLRALGAAAPDVRYYKGTAFIMEKEEELKAALRTFFGCPQVEARVISGQMANDVVYDALLQFRNRFRRGQPAERIGRVLVHDLNKGGHLSAQVQGALRNYVGIDPVTERPAVEHFPIRTDDPHRIDVEETRRIIAETRPELIVFGRSVIIHREPVREIARFVFEEFGRDNPQRPLLMYDGAHVLGLLGAHYQDPFAEGADIVTGSTHKTFFGPQRGVILSNIAPGSPFEPLWSRIESRAFPGHVSNHHLGTLLGLLGATYEMLHFRGQYVPQVIANAKAYARALADAGLVLEGDPACEFTETHQVLLRGARAKGGYLAALLEQNNIITNPQAYHDDPSFAAASGVRMGSQEMTRYGMAEEDFRELAALIADIVEHGQERRRGYWKKAVKSLRSRFLEMRYCF